MRRHSRRRLLQGLALAGFSLLSGCEKGPKVPRIGFLAVGSREGRSSILLGSFGTLRSRGGDAWQRLDAPTAGRDPAGDLTLTAVTAADDGLWIGGVLQAVANLSFSWLAFVGVNQWALAFAITAENFTSAIGTVIFVAYLSALCRNPLHTATQYALLTALAAVGRTHLSSGAGFVAKVTGWPLFFAICVAVGVFSSPSIRE